MLRDIKIRYVFKNKNNGSLFTLVLSLDDIQCNNQGLVDLLTRANYELIARDEYSGLKDKNGKEFYEGDIITCMQYIDGNFVDCCIERGYVEMMFGAFGLHRKQGYYRPFKDWLEDYEFEVIGNIHDNPELLKGESK